jgi:3-oxoacyl-[acyl-carrier protein] reductase
LAEAFARAGAAVVLSGRRLEQVTEMAQRLAGQTGARVHGIQLDLSQAQSAQHAVAEAAQWLGGLDVVVCCAGAPADGRIEEVEPRAWRESFEVKFFGTVDVVRESLAHLRRSGGGVVITLSGLLGREPQPANIVSGCINAALENFTKCISREAAADGIRAVALCPGPFETPRIRNILAHRGLALGTPYEEMEAAATRGVPIGRFGTPQEFARLAVFVASDACPFLTGTTITVDGGSRVAAF